MEADNVPWRGGQEGQYNTDSCPRERNGPWEEWILELARTTYLPHGQSKSASPFKTNKQTNKTKQNKTKQKKQD